MLIYVYPVVDFSNRKKIILGRQRPPKEGAISERYANRLKKRKANVDEDSIDWVNNAATLLKTALASVKPAKYVQVASIAALLSYGPRTIKTYARHVLHFLQNTTTNTIKSIPQLDRAIVQCGEQDYLELGRSHCRMSVLKAALGAYLPYLQKRLPLVRQLQVRLKQAEPSLGGLPMTAYAVGLFLIHLQLQGSGTTLALDKRVAWRKDRYVLWGMALLSVLLFELLGRISDLLKADVSSYHEEIPRGTNPAFGVFVLKHDPFNGVRQKGRVSRHLYVRSSHLHLLIMKQIKYAKQRRWTTIFNFNYYRFMQQLKGFSEFIGITGRKWTTHAFRHGGAEELDKQGVDPSTICHMGGWASTKNMRIYLAGVAQEKECLEHAIPKSRQTQGFVLFQRRYQVLQNFCPLPDD